MDQKKKSVLFVAAHPDDEILGAGGTIAKHVFQGDQVHVLILGEGGTSRNPPEKISTSILSEEANQVRSVLKFESLKMLQLPDQRLDTLPILELNQIVTQEILSKRPEAVYTHHFGDLNRDHKLTSEAVMVACRAIPNSSIQDVYFWETPSSTEWSHKSVPFIPQVYVDITEFLNLKMDALACYRSELREYPHPRSLRGVEIHSQHRGLEVGVKAAEAFQLFRSIR